MRDVLPPLSQTTFMKNANQMTIGETIFCKKDAVSITRTTQELWELADVDSRPFTECGEDDVDWYLIRSHGAPAPALRASRFLTPRRLKDHSHAGRCEDAPCCGCCG